MSFSREIMHAPHTLIAGTTGSGKSVLLNHIMHDILICDAPSICEFILIDPKRTELGEYRKLPHTVRYATETKDVLNVLDLTIREMERRLKTAQRRGTKTADTFRALYIIIDELADLMICPERRAVQTKLQRILQLGRAAKIHVIAATQAPNRAVIPAALVLNFTNRIALRCLNSIESRQIINRAGAELLPQYGKGIYLNQCGVYSEITIPPEDDAARRAVEGYYLTFKRK